MPLIKYNPCDCFYLSTEGVTMLTGFPRTRWPRWRFSESYAVQTSVKISRICEFRVIMGIMTGLLRCCSSSTLGRRANDYVKTLTTLGFWLHHSPCSLGCWTNSTLAAWSLSPNNSMNISDSTKSYVRFLSWSTVVTTTAVITVKYGHSIQYIISVFDNSEKQEIVEQRDWVE